MINSPLSHKWRPPRLTVSYEVGYRKDPFFIEYMSCLVKNNPGNL